jgi:hypothetical protein
MFLASPVKRDKNYEIRLLWYFSILYIRHINDQLFLFLSYFFVCFPTLFLLFLKLQSYFYPTFLHMPARKPECFRSDDFQQVVFASCMKISTIIDSFQEVLHWMVSSDSLRSSTSARTSGLGRRPK